jgi:excinuclease UvrABC nuclease subunit
MVHRLMGFSDYSKLIGSGIYALVSGDEVVYIGKSKQLWKRLYAHRSTLERVRQGKRPFNKMRAMIFDKVWIMACAISDMERIEKEWIGKLNPKYNRVHRTRMDMTDVLDIIRQEAPPKAISSIPRRAL